MLHKCPTEFVANEQVQAILKKIDDVAIQYGLSEWTLIMFDSKNGDDFEVLSKMQGELSLASFNRILLRMVKMCGQAECFGRLDS